MQECDHALKLCCMMRENCVASCTVHGAGSSVMWRQSTSTFMDCLLAAWLKFRFMRPIPKLDIMQYAAIADGTHCVSCTTNTHVCTKPTYALLFIVLHVFLNCHPMWWHGHKGECCILHSDTDLTWLHECLGGPVAACRGTPQFHALSAYLSLVARMRFHWYKCTEACKMLILKGTT